MTSFSTPSNPPGTALPGPMVHPSPAPGLCTKPHSGMTGIQELQDEILGLEKQLHGKRLELALAQGEKETARQHMHAMYSATQKQREFRIACSEQGGCFFDAAGGVDALMVQGRAVNG